MPATEPDQIPRLFETAFNAADLDGLLALYEPDAALIPQPDVVVEGIDGIRDSLRWLLDRKGRMAIESKLVLRVGDLAYLSSRWSLRLSRATRTFAQLPPHGAPPPSAIPKRSRSTTPCTDFCWGLARGAATT